MDCPHPYSIISPRHIMHQSYSTQHYIAITIFNEYSSDLGFRRTTCKLDYCVCVAQFLARNCTIFQITSHVAVDECVFIVGVGIHSFFGLDRQFLTCSLSCTFWWPLSRFTMVIHIAVGHYSQIGSGYPILYWRPQSTIINWSFLQVCRAYESATIWWQRTYEPPVLRNDPSWKVKTC